MILCFFFVPETAGTVINPKQGKINSMSLEELNYIFGVKTMRHARYQLTEMGPWILRKARSIFFGPFVSKWTDVDDPNLLWRWADPEPLEATAIDYSGEETDVASEKAEAEAIEIAESHAEQARARVSRFIDLAE